MGKTHTHRWFSVVRFFLSHQACGQSCPTLVITSQHMVYFHEFMLGIWTSFWQTKHHLLVFVCRRCAYRVWPNAAYTKTCRALFEGVVPGFLSAQLWDEPTCCYHIHRIIATRGFMCAFPLSAVDDPISSWFSLEHLLSKLLPQLASRLWIYCVLLYSIDI